MKLDCGDVILVSEIYTGRIYLVNSFFRRIIRFVRQNGYRHCAYLIARTAKRSLFGTLNFFRMVVLVCAWRLRPSAEIKRAESELEALLSRACGSKFSMTIPLPGTLRGLLLYGAFRRFSAAQIFARLSAINHRQGHRPLRLHGPRTSERLRILYVSSMFPSPLHAGGLRLFDILNELSERNDVDLYTIMPLDEDGPSLARLRKGLKHIRLAGHGTFGGDDLMNWFSSRGIEPGYYDVIQYEYPSTATLIREFGSWGRKQGFTMMECISKRDFMHLHDTVKAGKNPTRDLWRFLESAAVEEVGVRDSDFCIALTDDDADFANRVFGVECRIVPTGISNFAVLEPLKQLDRQAVTPARPSAIFLGYYGHYPNLQGLSWYLENVHPEVKKRVPDYVFKIVGRGDLSGLRAKFDRDSSVEFVGEVGDIIPYIAESSVCLAPLISGAGFRGKVNQYAAVGKPIVSTSIGVSGLPYRNGHSIFVADEPSEFATSVHRILTDPQLAGAMAKAAEQLALSNFSWAAITKDLERIYET